MKKVTWLFIVCFTLVPLSRALAESKIPNLVGVWKVRSEGAIWTRQANDSEQAKDSIEFTKLNAETVIEKQSGRLFYGYYKSPEKTEKFVGVVGHDNTTVHWTGRYGFGQARIVSPDTMQMIYLQTSPQGSQAWVETLTRQ
jgi:hypothetical protein